MIIHPDYNEEYVDNDVALLKFSTNDVDNLYEDSILTGDRRKSGKRKRPFKSTITYSPACLPEQDEELPVDSHCMIMGWGKSKETDKFGNDVLHEAEVRLEKISKHKFLLVQNGFEPPGPKYFGLVLIILD